MTRRAIVTTTKRKMMISGLRTLIVTTANRKDISLRIVHIELFLRSQSFAISAEKRRGYVSAELVEFATMKNTGGRSALIELRDFTR